MNVIRLERRSPQGDDDDDTGRVLQEMVDLHRQGRLASLSYVAQVVGHDRPLTGILGNYNLDPYAAMGAINRLWVRLSHLAHDADPPPGGG